MNDSTAALERSIYLRMQSIFFSTINNESNESTFKKSEYKLKALFKIEDITHIYGINKYKDDQNFLCFENLSLSLLIKSS